MCRYAIVAMRYTISQPHSGAQPTAAGHVYDNQFVLVYVVTIHANISQITPNCPRGFIPTRRGACCPGHLLGRPQEGLEAPSPLVTLTQLVAGENRRSLI